MIPVAAQMGAAPAVLMGFNLWAAEFSDAANGMIKGSVGKSSGFLKSVFSHKTQLNWTLPPSRKVKVVVRS
jgi:hypothetical protein